MAKPVPASGPILNNLVEGQGPTIVLIHGLATSLRDWDSLVPDLLDAGLRVCRVDMFGHGDSPKPGTPRLYNFKVVYGTLEEWIDSLGVDDGPLFLVGHSMGGYMSLMYALRYPGRVRAMTLIDPLYSLKQLPPFMINTHRLSAIGVEMLRLAPSRLVDTALGRGPTLDVDFSPSIRRRIVADVKRASPYILTIPSTLPDLTNELPKIEVPCQVIWGERDSMLNPESFPPMVASMPFAVGHLISGRGHQPHLENGRVNKLLIDFMQTNLLSQEEMLVAFGEEGEKLAWQYMLFEQYQHQTWLQSAFISKGPKGAEAAPLGPQTLEEKKALLMKRFESQLDELLAWHQSTPGSTSEQFDRALSDLQKLLDAEIIAVLLEGDKGRR